jgi:hypothetical protein
MLSAIRHPRKTTPLTGLAGAVPDLPWKHGHGRSVIPHRRKSTPFPAMPWSNGHGVRRRAVRGACAVAGAVAGMAARAALRRQRHKLEAATPIDTEE